MLAAKHGATRTLGGSVVNAGDLDGDGVPELVVGDLRNTTAGDRAGAVFVLPLISATTDQGAAPRRQAGRRGPESSCIDGVAGWT